MYQLITHFIFESDLLITNRIPIWDFPLRGDFCDWLQGSYEGDNNVALQCWQVASPHIQSPLKFAFRNSLQCEIKNENLVVLKPHVDRSTANLGDIEFVLQDFFLKYLAGTDRYFAFVNGDQQTFVQMWQLRLRHPHQYGWLIPVPGYWHWTLHILKGIFRVWGEFIIKPFSQFLNFKNVDLDVGNFHYAEDLLEIITLALICWISDVRPKDISVIEFLDSDIPALHYEVIYATIYHFVPYFITRSAIKYNKPLADLWKYWLHLFIATNKGHYARITIRFLWILQSLNPSISKAFESYQVFSFSGESGTGISHDGVNEILNWYMKHMNAKNTTESKLEISNLALNHALKIHHGFFKMSNKKKREEIFMSKTEEDVRKLFDWISAKLKEPENYKGNFWYEHNEPISNARRSLSMDRAFNKIPDYYVTCQDCWDGQLDVEIVPDKPAKKRKDRKRKNTNNTTNSTEQLRDDLEIMGPDEQDEVREPIYVDNLESLFDD